MTGSFIDISPWLGMPPEPPERPRWPSSRGTSYQYLASPTIPTFNATRGGQKANQPMKKGKTTDEAKDKNATLPQRTVSAPVPQSHYFPPPVTTPDLDQTSSSSDSESSSSSSSAKDRGHRDASDATQLPTKPIANFRHSKEQSSASSKTSPTSKGSIMLNSNLMLDSRFPDCFVRKKQTPRASLTSPTKAASSSPKPSMTNAFANMFGIEKRITQAVEEQKKNQPKKQNFTNAANHGSSASKGKRASSYSPYPPPPMGSIPAEDIESVSDGSSKSPTQMSGAWNFPLPPNLEWAKSSRKSSRVSVKSGESQSQAPTRTAQSTGPSASKPTSGAVKGSKVSQKDMGRNFTPSATSEGMYMMSGALQSTLRKDSSVGSGRSSKPPTSAGDRTGSVSERKNSQGGPYVWNAADGQDWHDLGSEHSTYQAPKVENVRSSRASSTHAGKFQSTSSRHTPYKGSWSHAGNESEPKLGTSSSRASQSTTRAASHGKMSQRASQQPSHVTSEPNCPRIITYRHVSARQADGNPSRSTTTTASRAKSNSSHKSLVDGPFESWQTHNPEIWSPASPPLEVWEPDDSPIHPFDSRSNIDSRRLYRGRG